MVFAVTLKQISIVLFTWDKRAIFRNVPKSVLGETCLFAKDATNNKNIKVLVKCRKILFTNSRQSNVRHVLNILVMLVCGTP